MERCLFYVSYLLFQVLKKKQKGTGDYYRGCVPGLKPRVAIINCSPLWLQTVHRTVCITRRARNALLVSEKINACFLTVGTDVLGCPLSSFFRRRKKKQKSRWDTCDCVPNPATLFGMRENKRSFSHCRDFRPLDCPNKTTARAVPGRNYRLLPALATNSPPDCLLLARAFLSFKSHPYN